MTDIAEQVIARSGKRGARPLRSPWRTEVFERLEIATPLARLARTALFFESVE